MLHVSARPLLLLTLLLLTLVALAGCVTSRVEIAATPSIAEASASDIAAGGELFPIVEAGQWGYMNRRGEVMIAPRYANATAFSEGRAATEDRGLWGYITPTGAWAVEPTYDTASPFSEGRALVSRGQGAKQRFGFVDASGAEVVQTVLPYALSYSEGRALARVTTGPRSPIPAFLARLGVTVFDVPSYVFLDRDGDAAFEIPGSLASSYAEGLAPFRKSRGLFRSSTWGYLDLQGNVAIAPTLDGPAFRHTEGLARMGQDGRLGFVNSAGAFVIPAEYDMALAFSEGLAPVLLGDRWGYIDASGALTIPARFTTALAFSDGLAPVEIGGRWGFIDPAGEVIIAPTYSRAERFFRGLARVYEGGFLRYIDASGTVVWSQQ